MKNKICIVTGANSGIGFQTALKLAQEETHVIMVCRNIEKGENARKFIIEKSNNKNIELFITDLSSPKQIYKLFDSLNSKYEKIDILINNAGALNTQRSENEKNIELTFATNHLGSFLLTNLLLSNSKFSENARIINIASLSEKIASIYWDDINLKNNYKPFRAYSQSKLANIIFTYKLAEMLKDTTITVNCIHPGVVASNFSSNTSLIFNLLFNIGKIFFRKPEKSAEAIVWLATSDEISGISGKYYYDKKQIKSKQITYNKDVQNKLWEISEKMINL